MYSTQLVRVFMHLAQLLETLQVLPTTASS